MGPTDFDMPMKKYFQPGNDAFLADWQRFLSRFWQKRADLLNP